MRARIVPFAAFLLIGLADVSAAGTPLTGVQAIAASGGSGFLMSGPGAFTCAVVSGGLKCWGNNFSGQLGDGTTTDRVLPTDVSALTSGVVAVAAAADFGIGGLGHTCALTSTGAVKCWGYNYYGGVGDGTFVTTSTPATAVESGIAAITGNAARSCALTTSGGVKCWGMGNYLPLPADGRNKSPVNIAGMTTGVTGVGAGGNYACAIAGGGVSCWGANYPPVPVAGVSSAIAISSGGSHACVIAAGGLVHCWGANAAGQLGDGSTTTRDAAAPVAGLGPVSAISAGGAHTCALMLSGGVKCWGDNSTGQLGDGSYVRRLTPVDVVGLQSGVTGVSAGGAHSCTVTAAGGALCWGNNASGELGDGSFVSRNVPGPVMGSAPSTPSPPKLAPESDTGAYADDGHTSVTTPRFTGTCATGLTIGLTVNGAPVQPTGACVGGAYSITLAAPLAQGTSYEVRAFGRNADGDSPPSSFDRLLTVDTTAPTATINCSPPAAATSSAGQFCFSMTDTPINFFMVAQCSLDGAAFTSCTSPHDLAGLSVGSHTFGVRAMDRAGNLSAVAAFTWNVGPDTVPDAFSFAPILDVAPGSTQTSLPAQVSGVNAAAPINVENGTYSVGCTTAFTANAGTVVPGDIVCVRHVAGAAHAAVTTTLTIGGVSGTFSTTATDLLVTPRSVAFGSQLLTQPSASVDVSISNNTSSPLQVQSVSAPAPFSVAHDCTTLASPGGCTARVTFTPVAAVAAAAPLAIVTAGGTTTVNLSGIGVNTLVVHYYRTLLRREPDTPGRDYWLGEQARAEALGLDPRELAFTLAATFMNSPEYRSFARSDSGFVTDLYAAFYNRAPDATGLAYWGDQLAAGLPREVAIAAFVFSPEFAAFARAIFGDAVVRAEVNLVTDFYRGFFARLPDNSGFAHWLGRFRTAQCAGGDAVNAEVEAVSRAFAAGNLEYRNRFRNDSQYVGDLYNAFLRRGGDTPGVQFWITELATKARENIRGRFLQSPEFQARVLAVIAQGCFTP